MNRYQTTKTINYVLKILAVSGTIGGSLLAPNAAELFTRASQPILEYDVDDKELKRLLKYMERTKLIELRVREGCLETTLSKKALERLRNAELDEIEISAVDVWDKKWRIVIYDIPKESNESRYFLLEQLKRLNFYKIQDSTWVYPFPCSKEILEIFERLELDKFVTFIVGSIESKDETKLIKHFQLYKHA